METQEQISNQQNKYINDILFPENIFEKYNNNQVECIIGNPLCQNNHQLQWKQQLNIFCQMCKQKSQFSRWWCKICNVSFCIFCKKPPTSTDICPLGHQIQKKTLYHNSCDICRKDIPSNSEAYRDQQCDFDICQKCKTYIIKED